MAGLALHVASRIEQAAEPGGILLSAACNELTSQYCDTRSAGTRALKGIVAPVEVFRLFGLKPGAAKDRFRDENLLQLRGREKELGIISGPCWMPSAELAASSAWSPRLASARAACATSSANGVASVGSMFRSAGSRLQQGHPTVPVLEPMRALFRIIPLTEVATARRQIAEKLLALGPSFEKNRR